MDYAKFDNLAIHAFKNSASRELRSREKQYNRKVK